MTEYDRIEKVIREHEDESRHLWVAAMIADKEDEPIEIEGAPI